MRRMIILSLLLVLGGAGVSPASGLDLYALVDTGELFVSGDDGDTWTVRSVLPVSDAIALIAGSSPSELFLASGSGTVYRSADAGMNWAAVGMVGAPDVVDLAGRTDGLMLTLTRSGVVYASANHGATFSARGTLAASNLVSLARGAANRVFALTETGEVARSNDAGMNWAVVGAVPVSDAVSLRAVDQLLFVLTATGFVYRSSDIGRTWTAVGTVSQTGMVALARASSTVVAISREGMVARSRNGGLWSWVGVVNQLHVTALANDTPQTIGVPPDGLAPGRFALAPPWPNPLPATDGRIGVGFTLPDPATVTVRLFDAAGRLVAERPPQVYGDAGEVFLSWRPAVRGAGVYFLHAATDRGGEATRRIVILP